MVKRALKVWRWHPAALVAALAGACLLWAGCSEKRDYRALSFFFDGVPDPNAPRNVQGGVAGRGDGAGARLPIASTHKPYGEDKCQSCHTNKQGLGFQSATLGADVCLTCHKTIRQAHAYMHGPVTAMACLWCHDPHQTPYPHLLRTPTPDVCLQCHDRELLSAKPPEHLTGGGCLNCHSGHGSSVRYLLKPNATTVPTTAPARSKDRT